MRGRLYPGAVKSTSALVPLDWVADDRQCGERHVGRSPNGCVFQSQENVRISS